MQKSGLIKIKANIVITGDNLEYLNKANIRLDPLYRQNS